MYDHISEYYIDFVQQGQKSPNSVFSLTIRTLLETLGEVKDLRILDLACGEGYLVRQLADREAYVTGVDKSSNLLEFAANQSSEKHRINYLKEDAQSLSSIGSRKFDLVVSNLALMDIPDLMLVYRAVARVLKENGRFVYSILHPCFETPFTAPDAITEKDEQGHFKACRVMRYVEEGHWNSGGTGIRGKVGAHHRKMSTYINGLIGSGFLLKELHEPSLPKQQYDVFEEQWLSKIPRALVVDAIRVS